MIPEGVTEIDSNVFKYCKFIYDEDDADFWGRIENDVEYGDEYDDEYDDEGTVVCKEVHVPGTVTKIKSGTFAYTSVEKLVFESGVEVIGDYAAESAWLLEEVGLPQTVREIGDQAFISSFSLRSIDLNNGLKSIGKSAFSGIGAEELVVPGTVDNVGRSAFYSKSLRFVKFEGHPEGILSALTNDHSTDMASSNPKNGVIEFEVDGELHIVPRFLNERIAAKYEDNIDDEKIFNDFIDYIASSSSRLNLKKVAFEVALRLLRKKGLCASFLLSRLDDFVLYRIVAGKPILTGNETALAVEFSF